MTHRLTAICCYLTGVIALLGLVFLVVLYVSFAAPFDGGMFGTLNDILYAIQSLLMVPVAVVLYRELRPSDYVRGRLALAAGIAGMLGLSLLQWLLVAGVLEFQVLAGLLLLPFAGLLYWFVVTGRIGREAAEFRHRERIDWLAAFYVGHAWWAYRVGTWLWSGRDEVKRVS